MAETISVLGCGWLGLPLGRRLAAQGFRVKGSTTTPEKRADLQVAGIEPYVLRLMPEIKSDNAAFFEANRLFLNVPPPRGRDDVAAFHRAQIAAVLRALRREGAPHHKGTTFGPPPIIFASSTGVYPDRPGLAREGDAPHPGDPARKTLRASARAVLEAEDLLRSAEGLDVTILRFGGLYGYDRQPGRFLAGRTDVEGGARPVNMIHRDDAVGLVEAVIRQDVRGEVFNACADAHPPRRVFYRRAAERLGLEPPTFQDEEDGGQGGKVVSSRKIKERLGYAFQHPDPLAEAP